jgi:hypothetical protein
MSSPSWIVPVIILHLPTLKYTMTKERNALMAIYIYIYTSYLYTSTSIFTTFWFRYSFRFILSNFYSHRAHHSILSSHQQWGRYPKAEPAASYHWHGGIPLLGNICPSGSMAHCLTGSPLSHHTKPKKTPSQLYPSLPTGWAHRPHLHVLSPRVANIHRWHFATSSQSKTQWYNKLYQIKMQPLWLQTGSPERASTSEPGHPIAEGFIQSKIAPWLFLWHDYLMVMYTDDWLIFAKDDTTINTLIQNLFKTFSLDYRCSWTRTQMACPLPNLHKRQNPTRDFTLDMYVNADFAGLWHQQHCMLREHVLCPFTYQLYYNILRLPSSLGSSRLTTESKYIALSMATHDLLPIPHSTPSSWNSSAWHIPLHAHYNTSKTTSLAATMIYEEKASCIMLANSEGTKTHHKHIALKWHHFRNQIKQGHIKLI